MKKKYTKPNLDDQYYSNLGKRCLDLRFYSTALSCYRKALEINPDSGDAKAGLEKILEIESKKLESKI